MDWDAQHVGGGATSARKRTRTGGGSTRSPADLRKLRGIISTSKFNNLHPYSTHGKLRLMRGTPISLETFGETRKLANAQQRHNRDSFGWTGRGLYTGRGRYNIRNFGHDVMNTFRTVSRAGGLKGMTNAFVGQGSYTLSSLPSIASVSNVLVTGGKMPITFHSPRDETETLIVSNSEIVGDIYGPPNAAFTNTKYELNPGLIENFPMLAQFAANFFEYEFLQLLFVYKSTVDPSSTNNPNGNTGTIAMCTIYNPDLQVATDLRTMTESHGGHESRLTDKAMIHGVECEPGKVAFSTHKYVRSGPVNDKKLHDLGILQLAIQNCPTSFQNQQVGKLEVYYTVRLTKPRLLTSTGQAGQHARFISAGGETRNALMGTNMLTARASNLPLSVVPSTAPNGGLLITFPASVSGIFELVLRCEGTTFVFAGTDITISGQIQPYNDIYGKNSGGDTPDWHEIVLESTASVSTARIKVHEAVSGVNNSVIIYPFGSTGTVASVTQTYLEVKEIGAQFQTSNSVSAPVWINSAGEVRDP